MTPIYIPIIISGGGFVLPLSLFIFIILLFFYGIIFLFIILYGIFVWKEWSFSFPRKIPKCNIYIKNNCGANFYYKNGYWLDCSTCICKEKGGVDPRTGKIFKKYWIF